MLVKENWSSLWQAGSGATDCESTVVPLAANRVMAPACVSNVHDVEPLPPQAVSTANAALPQMDGTTTACAGEAPVPPRPAAASLAWNVPGVR